MQHIQQLNAAWKQSRIAAQGRFCFSNNAEPGDQFRTTSHVYPEEAICHVSTCIYYNGQLESCCKCRDLSQQGLFSRSSLPRYWVMIFHPPGCPGSFFVGSFPQGFLCPSTPKWRVQSICGFDPPLLMACKKNMIVALKKRGDEREHHEYWKSFPKKKDCVECVGSKILFIFSSLMMHGSLHHTQS